MGAGASVMSPERIKIYNWDKTVSDGFRVFKTWLKDRRVDSHRRLWATMTLDKLFPSIPLTRWAGKRTKVLTSSTTDYDLRKYLHTNASYTFTPYNIPHMGPPFVAKLLNVSEDIKFPLTTNITLERNGVSRTYMKDAFDKIKFKSLPKRQSYARDQLWFASPNGNFNLW
jgi:hypothetical protein